MQSLLLLSYRCPAAGPADRRLQEGCRLQTQAARMHGECSKGLRWQSVAVIHREIAAHLETSRQSATERDNRRSECDRCLTRPSCVGKRKEPEGPLFRCTCASQITPPEYAASAPDKSCPDSTASACWPRRWLGTCWHRRRTSWRWPTAYRRAPPCAIAILATRC